MHLQIVSSSSSGRHPALAHRTTELCALTAVEATVTVCQLILLGAAFSECIHPSTVVVVFIVFVLVIPRRPKTNQLGEDDDWQQYII